MGIHLIVIEYQPLLPGKLPTTKSAAVQASLSIGIHLIELHLEHELRKH
jgi:hypothetical protein